LGNAVFSGLRPKSKGKSKKAQFRSQWHKPSLPGKPEIEIRDTRYEIRIKNAVSRRFI
jgi:hypothetical protein